MPQKAAAFEEKLTFGVVLVTLDAVKNKQGKHHKKETKAKDSEVDVEDNQRERVSEKRNEENGHAMKSDSSKQKATKSTTALAFKPSALVGRKKKVNFK